MKNNNQLPRFGWFAGVFIPTFLTIMGVIFYLRLGRVVASSGILGAVLIILIAESVVIATAFAICSICRREVSHGGVFSLITKTLGLNAGGSVGIPLFFAQAFSVVFYVFGFAEAWKFFFPAHPILITSLFVFALMFILTYIRIHVAIGAQFVVFALIIISLFSVFGAGFGQQVVPMIGGFAGTSFWKMFALFFPAVTGILAGVGLSGQLSNPKTDIPRGLFWGIGITAILYFVAAVWLGFNAPSSVLQDSLSMVRLSSIPFLVTVGILAATFSSGLVTFIAASRLFQALAYHNMVPFSKFFIRRKRGEPRNAILLISAISIGAFFLSDLNRIAFILTIFFLITYSAVNYAFFKKYAKGILRKSVALYGTIASAIIIFLVDIIGGLFALAFVILTYFWIKKRAK